MESRRRELLAELEHVVREHRRSVDALDDAVARSLGVNRTDLRTLDLLSAAAASPGALAAAIGLSPAAMTAALDRLEARSYVRRVRHLGDRRRVVVEMTEPTRRRVAELYAPLLAARERALAAAGDAHVALLRDFLRGEADLQDRHRARIATDGNGVGATGQLESLLRPGS